MSYQIQTYTIRPDGVWAYNPPIEVEHKHAPLWWHERGLSQTATGYGKRIATATMVRYNGKWRRVYCCIYSNVGTCYIGKLSDGLVVSGYPQ
jgi:hypothetical protein